jgi:hypothetical protein
MLIITAESHLDHGLDGELLADILQKFRDAEGFAIESVEVAGMFLCDLVGPLTGQAPVQEDEVFYRNRGGRAWPSRLTRSRPRPKTRILTVVMGPDEHGNKCVLYTAYWGPQAPREPGDPSLTEEERKESKKFWSQHALVVD